MMEERQRERARVRESARRVGKETKARAVLAKCKLGMEAWVPPHAQTT
jgi:hypothetical protein